MPFVPSLLLVLSLVLAVVVGPQTRSWSWGFALIPLGVAVLSALPVFWRGEARKAPGWLVMLGAAVVAWFGWRAAVSPVRELAVADMLLLGAAAGAFLVVRSLDGHAKAGTVLIWGLALLLAANVWAVGMQVADPAFAPIFGARPATFPSGFYAHYNEGANFLIGASLLLGGVALFGGQNRWVRVLWAVVAVAGLAAVYFTRSRGGILGAAVGAAVFFVVAMMIAKRRGDRWFAPALILVPAIGLAAGWFVFSGWQKSQELRNQKTTTEAVMDNTVRLHFMGVATSTIASHPWTGGGSRSFSWECNKFWDKAEYGILDRRPELVHNEMLQAATDYGLIGAGLLLVFVGGIAILAVVRCLFVREKGFHPGDAWRLGGVAAVAGMFVQASFSFVFHLLPGAMLLGVCLAAAAMEGRGVESRRVPAKGGAWWLVPGLTAALVFLGCAALLLPYGWKGAKVTRVLWDTHLSKNPDRAPEARVYALSEAIRIWPQAAFFQSRAALCQTLGTERDSLQAMEWMSQAVNDYREAARLHPYEPGPVVNLGNLLGFLGRDEEAEREFEKAVHLQGGMEIAFRASLNQAIFFNRRGLNALRAGEPEVAAAHLEKAVEAIERAVADSSAWMIGAVGRPMRIEIHESLGVAREESGDFEKALAAYDAAAALEGGRRAHYRAAEMLMKKADADWRSRKPAQALAGFLKAKARLAEAHQLPEGVTQARRKELAGYLDRAIRFLQEARVVPEGAED